MKFGDLTQIRYAVNCSILFTELPLEQRFDAVRAAGFEAIELWWPFDTATPKDSEVDALERAITAAGVSLVGLNFFAGNMPDGDRGVLSNPARSAEFRHNIDLVAGLGQHLGCRGFNALYGNRADGVDPEAQDDAAVENLALAAAAVERIGGVVLVEPVSGAKRYPLLTASDVVHVIDRVSIETGADNLGLLADLYHLAVNGDDVEQALADHFDRIAHVQIADAPGRNEPGTGNLQLADQLAALEARGYDGWVGLEYKSSGASADSFGWLRSAPTEQRRKEER